MKIGDKYIDPIDNTIAIIRDIQGLAVKYNLTCAGGYAHTTWCDAVGEFLSVFQPYVDVPKFKVGERIRFKDTDMVGVIAKVTEEQYEVVWDLGSGFEVTYLRETIEETCHLVEQVDHKFKVGDVIKLTETGVKGTVVVAYVDTKRYGIHWEDIGGDYLGMDFVDAHCTLNHADPYQEAFNQAAFITKSYAGSVTGGSAGGTALMTFSPTVVRTPSKPLFKGWKKA